MILLLFGLFLALFPVSIRLSASAIFGGGSTTITCTVPRDARNRQLRAGLVDYTESRRQLDGEDAPVTHAFLLAHIPCDAGAAYCALVRTDGSLVAATTTLIISCP